MKSKPFTEQQYSSLTLEEKQLIETIFPLANEISLRFLEINQDAVVQYRERNDEEKLFFSNSSLCLVYDHGNYSIVYHESSVYLYLKEKKLMLLDSNVENYKSINNHPYKKILGLIFVLCSEKEVMRYREIYLDYSDERLYRLVNYRASNYREEAFIPMRKCKTTKTSDNYREFEYIGNIKITQIEEDYYLSIDEIKKLEDTRQLMTIINNSCYGCATLNNPKVI